MSGDLRSLLDDIVEGEAPHLDALGPAERLARVRARATRLRRRRAGRALAAVVLVAAVLAVVRIPAQRLTEPETSPTAPAAALPQTWDERTRIAAIPARVDGPATTFAVLPPNADLQVLVRCSHEVTPEVTVQVAVAGHTPLSLTGCDADLAASFAVTQEEFWAPYGLRPGVPISLSVRASSGTGGGGDGFVYVGLYAAPPSALPAQPLAAPPAAGYRPLGTVTLDGEHEQATVELPLPASREVWFTASCGGQADGLEFMILVGDSTIAEQSCSAPIPANHQLAAVPESEAVADSVVFMALLSHHGVTSLRDRPPQAGARVVITFYARRP